MASTGPVGKLKPVFLSRNLNSFASRSTSSLRSFWISDSRQPVSMSALAGHSDGTRQRIDVIVVRSGEVGVQAASRS